MLQVENYQEFADARTAQLGRTFDDLLNPERSDSTSGAYHTLLLLIEIPFFDPDLLIFVTAFPQGPTMITRPLKVLQSQWGLGLASPPVLTACANYCTG